VGVRKRRQQRERNRYEKFLHFPSLFLTTKPVYRAPVITSSLIARSGSDKAIQCSAADWIASLALAMTSPSCGASLISPPPGGGRSNRAADREGVNTTSSFASRFKATHPTPRT
jgi:hypothetical protein